MENRRLFRGWIPNLEIMVQATKLHYFESGIAIEYNHKGERCLVDASRFVLMQCTGLSASKSYRGTKPEDLLIFENDLLQINTNIINGAADCGIIDSDLITKRIDVAIVMRDDKTGGYRLKVYHKGKYKRISIFSKNHLFNYSAEIIGNIHEHPSLLGVK